jgi:homoserine O-acetyltransferase
MPRGTWPPATHAGWWDDMIGPGRPLDTERLFVVCANVLGGCQGSTGPASIDPVTGRPYGSRFPTVTIRDIVRAQARLADHLGIGRWLCVVGGSMGGMQVLEWAVMYPERVRAFAAIATTVAASAWQIAWSATGRTALALDPALAGRRLLRRPPATGPTAGLAVARSIAQITYRSDEVLRRALRARARRPGSTASGCGAASRSRATSTTTGRSWPAGSTPTPTSCSTRRWTSTTSGVAAGRRSWTVAPDRGVGPGAT